MNWVGGARSRVCRPNIKSKKYQQKLQKEYFEKRRLGAINVNAIGTNARRTPNPKEAKSKISQDILDFQNLKHQIENQGAVSSNRARAAFRVVNLKKKPTAATMHTKPNGFKYEEVEMPLSPVEKHSALNLSQSPPSQEKNGDASCSANESILGRQDKTCMAPYNTLLTENKQRKLQHIHKELPSNLQLFGKKASENLPHILSNSNGSFSTIDLFGTTMEKPKKWGKPIMPPPSSYGVSSNKIKRKKPGVPIPGIDERWSSTLSSDTDYPPESTTHYPGPSRRDSRIPTQYGTTPTHIYSSMLDDDTRTDSATYQLVSSPIGSSMKDKFNHNDTINFEDMCNLEKSHSFQVFSPLRASDFVCAMEKNRDKGSSKPKRMSSFFCSESDRLHSESNPLSSTECYSPEYQMSSVISHKRPHLDRNLCHEQSTILDNKLYISSPNKLSSIHPDFNTKDFYCDQYNVGAFKSQDSGTNSNIYSTNVVTAGKFDFGERFKPESMRRCKSFKFTDDVSSSSNIMGAYSSTYHFETIQNTSLDGGVLVNQSMTAEWCNVPWKQDSMSPKNTSPTDRVSTMNDGDKLFRPSAFFEEAQIKSFEPLQASTPYTVPMNYDDVPICVNKEALDRDVSNHRIPPIHKDKLYPVKDLLDEMIDLETPYVDSQIGRQLKKTIELTPKEIKDRSVVEEILVSLVSRVDESIRQSYRTTDTGGLSLSATNQPHQPNTPVAEIKRDRNNPNDMAMKSGIMLNLPNGSTQSCQNSLPRTNESSIKFPASDMCADHLPKNYRKDVGHNSQPKYPEIDQPDSRGDIFFSPDSKMLTSQSQSRPVPQNMTTRHDGKTFSISPTHVHKNDMSNTFGELTHLTIQSHQTVSTQTIQKRFTDTASSPIVIFACEEHHDKDLQIEKNTTVVTPKVYSLRRRTRLHENDISKKEE